jgi:hypothetical protein
MATHRLIPAALVCVPQSQRREYKKAVGDRILTHPDSVKGLPAKLNWILRHFKDDDVVMFDDDLDRVVRCFGLKGEEQSIKSPERVHAIIESTLWLARDLGVYFFGWDSSNTGVIFYDGFTPFQLSGYITGCAKGFLRGHGLVYDERLRTKDDFDMSAQNAYKHRMCLKNMRYTFMQLGTFANAGGQAAFRTPDVEKRDVEMLRRKWGSDVIRFRDRHTPRRKRDYAGITKISLRLPF